MGWILGDSENVDVAATMNYPGSFHEAQAVMDLDNNRFFFILGDGYDLDGQLGELNDVWEFDIDLQIFVNVTGSQDRYQESIFTEGAQVVGGVEEFCAASEIIDGKIMVFGGAQRILELNL